MSGTILRPLGFPVPTRLEGMETVARAFCFNHILEFRPDLRGWKHQQGGHGCLDCNGFRPDLRGWKRDFGGDLLWKVAGPDPT